MNPQFQPAIEALQKDLAAQENKVNDLKKMINALCIHAGAQPIYTNLENTSSTATISSIKSDTFYGKTVLTACREYLEMRKAANLGPASPRDVYEALKKGGFVFLSKSEVNSITVVRNGMSKASSTFHRLPSGDYGLVKWYDKFKTKKVKDGESGEVKDDVGFEIVDEASEGDDLI